MVGEILFLSIRLIALAEMPLAFDSARRDSPCSFLNRNSLDPISISTGALALRLNCLIVKKALAPPRISVNHNLQKMIS
jgi:hypothetical protein